MLLFPSGQTNSLINNAEFLAWIQHNSEENFRNFQKEKEKRKEIEKQFQKLEEQLEKAKKEKEICI